MQLTAILVGIAMIALVQSACIYGAVYFTFGKLISLEKRAALSGLLAAFASLVLVGIEAIKTDIFPLSDVDAVSSLTISLVGIAVWTWRTHVSDRHALQKSPPDSSSGLS